MGCDFPISKLRTNPIPKPFGETWVFLKSKLQNCKLVLMLFGRADKLKNRFLALISKKAPGGGAVVV